MNFFQRFHIGRLLQVKWGAQSLVSLYISVISGIIVAFQYNPYTPFYSIGSLDVVVPFGRFWRALHFYSSQFFFILLLVHLAVVLFDKRLFKDDSKPGDSECYKPRTNIIGLLLGKWTLLTLSVPVSALVLFTGYILRFDSTGESAGYIAENIIRSIPFFGEWLDAFLFNISSVGLKVVYVNHVIGLGCLWGYLVWSHLRKYRVNLSDFGILTICILGISYLLPAPVEPSWPGNFHILGPWFFIGLQELLRYLQPFWAGIILPVIGLLFLIFAVNDGGRMRLPVKGTIAFSLVYVVLTVIGWNR